MGTSGEMTHPLYQKARLARGSTNCRERSVTHLQGREKPGATRLNVNLFIGNEGRPAQKARQTETGLHFIDDFSVSPGPSDRFSYLR